jgi:hypothetical protein
VLSKKSSPCLATHTQKKGLLRPIFFPGLIADDGPFLQQTPVCIAHYLTRDWGPHILFLFYCHILHVA